MQYILNIDFYHIETLKYNCDAVDGNCPLGGRDISLQQRRNFFLVSPVIPSSLKQSCSILLTSITVLTMPEKLCIFKYPDSIFTMNQICPGDIP